MRRLVVLVVVFSVCLGGIWGCIGSHSEEPVVIKKNPFEGKKGAAPKDKGPVPTK